MRIKRLAGSNLRILKDFNLEANRRFNFIIGKNASGKTSLLEAVYVLSAGKSFLEPKLETLIRKNSKGLSLFAFTEDEKAVEHRLGVGRDRQQQIDIRIDGEKKRSLSQLAMMMPTLALYPGSEALLSGGPKERRQYVDWGLFHVKHDYHLTWSKYQRALEQRNAVLRKEFSDSLLDTWDTELAQLGEEIDLYRKEYLAILHPKMEEISKQLLECHELVMRYGRGWPEQETLLDSIGKNRARDKQYQQTNVGPHRAELQIRYRGMDARREISRGQAKAITYTLKLAQAALLKELTGKLSILLIDDLPSELDENHHCRIQEFLMAGEWQVFLTAIDQKTEWDLIDEKKVFHVEQGALEERV